MMVIKLNSTNDTNGNPRRGWLILGPAGDTNRFIDEGNQGMNTDRTIEETYGPIKAVIKVSASEYRRFRRECGVQL